MSKADKIKETLRQTREKRKSQDCKVFELKVDESKLNSVRRQKLNNCFIQSKWIYNHLVGQSNDVKFQSSQKQIDVTVFNPDTQKCDKIETRNLTIGSQIKQAVCERFVQNIISLSKLKAKGYPTGKLNFVKDVDSVPLKQHGVTYKIIDNKTISIQSIGRLKVRGLAQLKDKDIANAHLVKKPSGIYIHVTCYEPKNQPVREGEIGIDFGIKDSVVLSDGTKFSWNFEIPKTLKRSQKKLSKKQFGSRNYVKQKQKVRKIYEKYINKKDDAANQFVASLKKYNKVVIQDENIKGWHSGLFGKQVQQSILGRIKTRIKKLETSVVIDRWIPTTQISPLTGQNIKIPLNQRMFVDGDFSEDRDIKSAKTILCFGLYNPNLTSKELRSLPVEDRTSIFKNYVFESKFEPLKQEALVL